MTEENFAKAALSQEHGNPPYQCWKNAAMLGPMRVQPALTPAIAPDLSRRSASLAENRATHSTFSTLQVDSGSFQWLIPQPPG
jgi:hypothetical protein